MSALPTRPNQLTGLRAAAFTRVSTDHQQLSPTNQRRIIDGFANEHGIEIVLTKQLTISGRDAWRDPAVVEITEAAEAGRIQAVIVSTLDRMGRSPRTDIFIDDLHDAGAILIDAGNEQLSGNRADRRAMRTGIAQAGNERDLIRERVTTGIRGHQSAHDDPWGHPALGYRRLPASDAQKCHTECSHRILNVDPGNAREVIALFERYAAGTVSIDQLAANPPTVRHGRRRGHPMTREGIASLLANPIYIGTAQRPDLRIVPDDLWHTVQTVRGRRTRAGGPTPANRVNLYRGLLYCASCDRKLSLDGTGSSGRHAYHRIRHPDPCEAWGTRERRPLSLWAGPLSAQIASLNVTDTLVTAIVDQLRGDPPNVTPISFAQRRDAIYREHRAKRITGNEADARIAQVDADEASYRAEQATKPVATAAEVRHALEQLQTAWAVATDSARAQVAASLYSKIRLGPDGTFPEDAIELSPDALAHGLQWALPEEVEHPFDASGWLACPRGLEPPTFRSAT
ncbi:MAG: recombinase family protein [Candidatus Limnocylindria bacterium]